MVFPISVAIQQIDTESLVVRAVSGTEMLVIGTGNLRDLYCLGNLDCRCCDSCEILCYLHNINIIISKQKPCLRIQEDILITSSQNKGYVAMLKKPNVYASISLYFGYS